MAKDPAFLFYTGDFTTGTQFMSDEQVGKYLRLLMAQHQHGRLSEKQVIFICKTNDIEVMAKFQKDEDGMYFNERLEVEINKRKAFSESRSNNKKGKTKEVNNISKSYDNHMEDENENKDINKNIIKREVKIKEQLFFPFESEIFLKVWNLLLTQPKWKKKSHTALQASLKKLSEHDEQTAIKMMENTIAGEWQGLFEIKQQNNKQGNSQPSKIDQYRAASEAAKLYFNQTNGE